MRWIMVYIDKGVRMLEILTALIKVFEECSFDPPLCVECIYPVDVAVATAQYNETM